MVHREVKQIVRQLDEITKLLKMMGKQPSTLKRVIDGMATGAGILGFISIIDVLRSWLGG